MNVTYGTESTTIPWITTDIFATSCVGTILLVFVCCACVHARERHLQLNRSTPHEML